MATAKAQTGSSSAIISRYAEPALVLLILLLAGWLRMAFPGLTEFKADEARLLDLALDMADGQFALRGISSSVGFPNFPASVWIYSLPLFIWPHPYAATLFTGLLNTLAIAAAYWFVRRYWGITSALVAISMFAVSPWAVIFSRKIWAQNLLPLFVIGWAISAVLALVEERPKFIWLHFLCLALAIQIHLAAVALLPATALLLLIFRRRVHWRSLLIGVVIALLTVIPFVIYLLQTGKDITLPEVIDGQSQAALTVDSLRFTAMISLGSNIHSLAGAEAYREFLTLLPPMTPVYWLWGLLILGGSLLLAWQVWKNWEQPSSQAGLVVLVWLFTPLLFFLWHSTPVFLHYFIATLPAQYIAAAVAFARIPAGLRNLWPGLSRRGQQVVTWGAWAIFLLTLIFQFWSVAALTNFLGHVATPGAFGVPLAMKLQTAERARALIIESGSAEILVAGEGESPRLDAFPAVWNVLLRDTPHRFVDVRRAALFPAQPAVVILDGRDTNQPWTGDLYQEAASQREEITLRPGEGSFYVLGLDQEARPQPDHPLDEPLLLANWVNLLGRDKLRMSDPATGIWQIHWRTGDNPDPAQYQFFNHLVDNNRMRVSQVDKPAFAPWQWSAGDTLISRFLIPWPESASTPLGMRVGMYRFPSLENVPLLDEAGNPYVDAVYFPIDNDGAENP